MACGHFILPLSPERTFQVIMYGTPFSLDFLDYCCVLCCGLFGIRCLTGDRATGARRENTQQHSSSDTSVVVRQLVHYSPAASALRAAWCTSRLLVPQIRNAFQDRVEEEEEGKSVGERGISSSGQAGGGSSG